MIPRIIHCTIPVGEPNAEVRGFWEKAQELHPGWRFLVHQDPLDPAEWPLTAPYWVRCETGAQLAGLIRLEALITHGGIYFDSDFEPLRSFDPLLGHRAFACWEDANVVPDAVLGAEPGHPAMVACLDLAIERLHSASTDWRTGPGTWSTGPGVTTTILPGRDDVTLLPTAAFYPYPYTERYRRHEDFAKNPDTYGAHHWAASWLPKIEA